MLMKMSKNTLSKRDREDPDSSLLLMNQHFRRNLRQITRLSNILAKGSKFQPRKEDNVLQQQYL